MQEININYFSIPGILKNVPNSPDTIINAVCEYFQKEKKDIYGKNRKRDLVTARHIAIYLIKQQTGLTLKLVGEKFGKDHTTIIHVMQKINDFIYIKDEQTIRALEIIKNNIRTHN